MNPDSVRPFRKTAVGHQAIESANIMSTITTSLNFEEPVI